MFRVVQPAVGWLYRTFRRKMTHRMPRRSTSCRGDAIGVWLSFGQNKSRAHTVSAIRRTRVKACSAAPLTAKNLFAGSDQMIRAGACNDRGTGYRSAIFYTSPDLERVARDTITDVDAGGLCPGKAGDRACTRRRLLEGRTGASGLSGALSYLSLRPPELEAAAEHGELIISSIYRTYLPSSYRPRC